MVHSCVTCGGHYDYTPEDRHTINLAPRVCSGKCFVDLLMDKLKASDILTLENAEIFHMNSGIIKRSAFEDKLADWFVSLGFRCFYEAILFKPAMYVPDFLIQSLGYPGYVIIEGKGLWSGAAYKKVKDFRTWLEPRNTDIYVIDDNTYRRINGKK